MPPKAGKLSAFMRAFDPEFLRSRADTTPVMLQCAQGHVESVAKYLNAPGEHNEFELLSTNLDGNTMLLLAVANGYTEMCRLLLEMKSDVCHKNLLQFSALDYAIMNGARTPLAKAIFSYCEFVVPQVVEGALWSKSLQVTQQLLDANVQCANTSILGRRPDLLHPTLTDADYTKEWVNNVRFMVANVKKGILLLTPDIAYLERDALIAGVLEIPAGKRYVYLQEAGKAIKFQTALERSDVYRGILDNRVMDMCLAGNDEAVHGLLKAGASENPKDIYGHTALMRASQMGATKVVECLLQASALVNAMSKDGYTSMLMAAVNGHCETVRILMRARADLQSVTTKGNSIMSFIRHEGQKEILDIISCELRSRRGSSRSGRSASATSAVARRARRRKSSKGGHVENAMSAMSRVLSFARGT